jgi:hypothetical protein
MASTGSESEGLEESMLEGEPESEDLDQMLKEAHPDNGGSREEFQRVLELRERQKKHRENGEDEGILESILDQGREAYDVLTGSLPTVTGNGSNGYLGKLGGIFGSDEEEDSARELPEPGVEDVMQEEYRKLLEIDGIEHEHAVEALEYDGNTQLARKAIEAEWKIDNAENYLDWQNFSQSSVSGEAELILTELDRDEREEIIGDLAETSSEDYGEITQTWTQHGHLMGYSTEKGHPVKLIDSYEQLDHRIEKRENSLMDMVRETKNQVEEYGKAAVKSIIDPETNGEIDDQELLQYADARIG